MAVELRDPGGIGESPGADSDSCVIVKPANLAVGDFMGAQVIGRGIALDTATSPGGWTFIRQDYDSVQLFTFSALFWKIADAADVAASDFTFTATGASSNRGIIVALTGHDATTPVNAHNGQGNAAVTTVTSPEIIPSVANCMILLFCGIGDNNTQSGYAITNDNPASWTEAYDLPSDLASDLGLSLGYALRPETTATGNGTATTSAADLNTGQLVAIAPAVAAPPALKYIPHCGPRKKRTQFFPTLRLGG